MLEVLNLLGLAGVQGLVDGGWGVEALMGTQTRAHEDLDVAIDRTRLADASHALSAAAYAHDPAARPGLPARYVMRDHRDRQVDLHLLTFDAHGNGWQQLSPTGAWGLYPVGERVTGVVEGIEVPCISAELQHRFHLGWAWDERAKHDMRLLREQLAIPLPPGYTAD
ncbi:MAG: amino acid transporter [Actinomycetota bacterium]|nr:amino acid transporter [Actinomycetota bacterium]